MEFDGDASLAPCDDWTNYMRGVVAQYLPSLPGGSCAFEAAVLSTVLYLSIALSIYSPIYL